MIRGAASRAGAPVLTPPQAKPAPPRPARRESPAASSAALPGRVRPAREADLPVITRLHREVFGPVAGVAAAELERLLGDLFFRHPWREQREHRLDSLVYEHDGEVVGALGVLPRPLLHRGRPLLAALGHNFVLRADRRTSLAAIEMLRVFLAGPQQLSYTFGNETTRKLWRGVGVEPSLPLSLRFTCPLRPVSHAARLVARRRLGPLRPLLRLAGATADLVTRVPGSPFRTRPVAGLDAETLEAEDLVGCVERYARRRALRPLYDTRTLRWVLERLARRPGAAAVRSLLLRRDGGIAGWYVYTLDRDRVAELLQVGAVPTATLDVLDHLRHDAASHGAVAVTGLLEPGMLEALGRRPALVHRGAATSWLMAHGDSAAVAALRSGDAFLSGLEGEWWA